METELIERIPMFPTMDDMYSFVIENKDLIDRYADLANKYWDMSTDEMRKWPRLSEYVDLSGVIFEKLATQALIKDGWTIYKAPNIPGALAINYNLAFGTNDNFSKTEIDLIAEKNGKVMVFEFKSNPRSTFKHNQIKLIDHIRNGGEIEVFGEVLRPEYIKATTHDYSATLSLERVTSTSVELS